MFVDGDIGQHEIGTGPFIFEAHRTLMPDEGGQAADAHADRRLAWFRPVVSTARPNSARR
jgi:hypothetical protein